MPEDTPPEPVKNRRAPDLEGAFGRFLRERKTPTPVIHMYMRVLADYLWIAKASGLLALPTRLVLGSGTWGWTFQLEVDLGAGDKLTFAVQKRDRQYGILHELERGHPIVTAWRSNEPSHYEMCWPGPFPDEPGVLLGNVDMVAVYTAILKLAVQAPVFAGKIPRPQSRWWRKK